MVKIITKIKDFVRHVLFGKIIREYKYRKRIKELRKRDPFTYH